MASFPVISTTTLGKRKAVDLGVLHLSTELPPIIVNGTLVKHTKKRYQCTHSGCIKSYTKPCRLEEHERSHTGERPFICETCRKSYLRETHLQAHIKSHLPNSDRPFQCLEEGCEKRFWTSQHLRIHENLHRGEKPFKCTELSCNEAFTKHHQLRTHRCTAHAPAGTKPYICEQEGCTKSFSNKQKLDIHAKVHDEKRYTCVHISCIPREGDSPIYYPTWTSLQGHIRIDHPPTCHHPSCDGKTFASQRGLRDHQKLHEQRDAEANVNNNNTDEDGAPRKRRRGGELGRDWVCEVDECGKDFKSKQALAIHNKITHLGLKEFVCPHIGCKYAFGYKRLLQRHLTRAHSTKSSSEDESISESSEDEPPPKRPSFRMDIDTITGVTYAQHASAQAQKPTVLRCPHPHINSSAFGAVGNCAYVFSRAYDLRRHLKSEHNTIVEKEWADQWVIKARAARIRSPVESAVII